MVNRILTYGLGVCLFAAWMAIFTVGWSALPDFSDPQSQEDTQ